ncbi:MAG TPA: GntR family transcriptional regulator [Rectinemataceae bacterium]|nr:GntR family transcriptional regulator [Rectinemataceae bacterium]
MADSISVIRSKPVADQATDILRERIRRGIYPPDQRMPSEAQLAEELQISRSSLRSALASLAAEGYIRRRHGDGTYSCLRSFQLTLRTGKDWDIERQILQSGRKPSLQVFEMGPRAATAEESAKLALAAGSNLFAIRRLLFADERPIGLIESLIDLEGLAPNIPRSEGELPSQHFLELYHERKAKEGEIRFMAALADGDLARRLDTNEGAPLLRVEGRYHDSLRRPLLLIREWYRGEEGFELQVGLLHS